MERASQLPCMEEGRFCDRLGREPARSADPAAGISNCPLHAGRIRGYAETQPWRRTRR